ncbi:HesA/MoeB/ThiF family protein [Thermonema rossianum]|uniref:HesA/MoeB/ThiF family protein n=1 Tax=Thermonema rossianum TaxID=55505 RepID=UPI00057167E9|nr:HesA/MoeB/ThiF family protein [Thermonema rossianum]
MLSTEENLRYDRHLRLQGFGLDAQLRLKQAKVLVVGAGGLGCPVLQYLAAAGVGTLGIVDGDTVSLSNLQRQPLYTPADIGKNKAETAAERLKAFNPLIAYEVYPFFLTADNAIDLIARFDVVVDGSDSFATRYLVNDACVIAQKPLVYGAVFRFEGQVAVFNYKGSATYRCLFPEPPLPHEMPACSEAGVLGILPGIVGMWQANEVIKLLTGIGQPLVNTLMTLDLLTNQTNCFRFYANPENLQLDRIRPVEWACSADTVRTLKAEDFLRWQAEQKPFALLDVRTEEEYAQENIGGSLCPLSQVEQQFVPPAHTQTVVVLCQGGVRARQAAARLQQLYPQHEFWVLEGGLNALRQYQAAHSK